MAGVASLSRRLAKLEGIAGVRSGSNLCDACGLRHVQPLSIEDTRGIMAAPIGECTEEQVARWRREHPHPGRLCLCDCCAESRLIAEWSHRTYRG